MNWSLDKDKNSLAFRNQLLYFTAILNELRWIPRVRERQEIERTQLLHMLAWHKDHIFPDILKIPADKVEIHNALVSFKEEYENARGSKWDEQPISTGHTAFTPLELLLRYLFLSRSSWKIGKSERACAVAEIS